MTRREYIQMKTTIEAMHSYRINSLDFVSAHNVIAILNTWVDESCIHNNIRHLKDALDERGYCLDCKCLVSKETEDKSIHVEDFRSLQKHLAAEKSRADAAEARLAVLIDETIRLGKLA